MRRVGSVLLRLLGALVSVALVAGLVVLPGWDPVEPAPADAMTVPVPAAPTDLVCPGPVRPATAAEEGGGVTYDPQFDPAPVDSVTTVGALTADRPDGPAVPAEVRPLADRQRVLAALGAAAGGGVAEVDNPDTGVVVHADPGDGGPAWAAGTVVVRTAAGDLRGLAGATCRPAVNEAWLVGGSTSIGSSARLVLQNPGRTPAQVSLELWGPAGQVELAGSSQYLVPAGSERVVLLEGAAAEQPRIVVHMVASGGLVAAYLQDSELRGLTSAGVDDVVPGTVPSTRQVIPGVSVLASTVDGVDTGVLRLLAPGKAGTAKVHVLGPAGQSVLPGAGDVQLDAGAVLDVPLGGLPAGAWTIVVDSDVPVVAGAMITRGAGVGATTLDQVDPLERAWAAAVAPGTTGPVALLPDIAWQLVLAVPDGQGGSGSAAVQVDMVGPAGLAATISEDVSPGTSVSLTAADFGDAPAARGLVIRSADPRVVWAVVLESSSPDGGMVSVLSPLAPREASGSVAVRFDYGR